MPQIVSATPAPPRPATRKRFTRGDCEFLERSGLLTGRYELIDGDILTPMPQKNRHALAVLRLALWLASVFGVERARSQATVELGPHNLPEPDGFALREPIPTDQDYPDADDLALVVEVSDTTLADDLGVKARLYASAAIAEYWVLDIAGRRVIVHREPSAEGYAQTLAYATDEALAPLAAPESPIAVAALLPEDDAA